MRARWIEFVAVSFVLAVLGGCVDGGREQSVEPTATTTTSASATEPTGNNTLNVTVRVLNHTAEARANEAINVTWEVSVNLTENETLRVDHTDAHYGNRSLDQPRAQDAYGNNTDPQSGAPGLYTATFTVNQTGRYFLRAHARVNGTNYWSPEVGFNVSGAGKVWTVTIGATTSGPSSDYEPNPLTIQAGDQAKWSNNDSAQLTHTATSDPGSTSPFDTGDIGAGAESDAVSFEVPGTFTYRCRVHPESMKATIIVTS